MTANHDAKFEHSWTVGLIAVMSLANLGLWIAEPAWQAVIEFLQFDRGAILRGDIWRLLTGNIVHWSTEHVLLDVAAFAVLGWLYEPALHKSFEQTKRPFQQLCSLPVMLLVSGCGVGLVVLSLRPDVTTYRGLSGVDSGLFAAALILECRLAKRDAKRWLIVLPALLVFTTKLLFELATGRLFFETDSLGDLGQPVPLAHLAGTVFAAACFYTRGIATRHFRPQSL